MKNLCYTTSHINQQQYTEKCWCYPELNALLYEMITIIAELFSWDASLHEHKQYYLPGTNTTSKKKININK